MSAVAAGAPGAPRTLVVDPRGAALGADGSASRPFKTVSGALAASRDGDVIDVHTGLYEEVVSVQHELTLRGPPSAVLASPNREASVIVVRAKATVIGLALQGGTIGVEAQADTVLERVAFSAQRRAAVLTTGAAVTLRGGTASALFERADLVGVEAENARVSLSGLRLEGPFRFGVRAKGGALAVRALESEGPVVGVACLDGADCLVEGSQLTLGRGAGLLVGGATLRARDNLVSRFEQCVAANPRSTLTLEDNTTAFCQLAGVHAAGSKVRVSHHLHVTPAHSAAVELINCSARVEESVLVDPGANGVFAFEGELAVEGGLVRGAKGDRDGDFGNGLLAHHPRALTLNGFMSEGGTGAGVVVLGGKATLRGVESNRDAFAGLIAESGAEVRTSGHVVAASGGPGIVAIEGASVRAILPLLSGNAEGAGAAQCEGLPSVVLDGARLDAPLPCVESRLGKP